MHPRLLMGGMSDRKRQNCIKRLPYSVQEQIFSGARFKLLTQKGETLMVDMMEATQEQVEQLCGDSSIRSLGEQKAWSERLSVSAPIEVEQLPYVILKGRISFRRGVTLSKQEMRNIISEM